MRGSPIFSQTTDYVLRVVAYLASLGGRPATTSEISGATKIPEGYLAKIIRQLNLAGILVSTRGLHGGSVLAKPAEKTTVFEVIDAICPIPRIVACPLGIESHCGNLCRVHRKLDDAMALVEKAFREATVADLLADSEVAPLCKR